MRTLLVIVFFWLALTAAIAKGNVWAIVLTMLAFLVVWSWSEELDYY